MAFPFLQEEKFEAGTRGTFDATSDSTSRLTFPHYSDLAAIPFLPAPYKGAYCMRVNLATSTTDAYVQETGSWDLAATNTIFLRFMMWVSPRITMANNDEFAVLQLWSATNTPEASIVINFTTANGLRLGIGETGGTNFLALSTGVWHAVELKAVIDAGGGNDGTLDLTLDGSAATQITGLDQGAITSGILGVVAQDAGTTKGDVLFDWLIADDAQIYPPDRRFATTFTVTSSQHLFVGPGCVENITLRAGAATDCVAQLFDTDVGNTNDAFDALIDIGNTANSETVDPAGVPVDVIRGAYLKLAGTNPRAVVKISPKVAWGSDGAIRSYGLRRVPQPRNV